MRYVYLMISLFLLSCSSGIEFSQVTGDMEYTTQQSSRCLDCAAMDNFVIKPSEIEMDIIFVLDVSSSMKKNLEKLGSAMQSFLSHIKDFNWKIGFTTADHGDHVRRNGKVGEERASKYSGEAPHFGRLMRLEYRGSLLDETILEKDSDFLSGIFYDTLTINNEKSCSLAPFCQGDHEQPLRALKSSFEIKDNKNFFTSDHVIAIIITNEDERDADKKNATTSEEVLKSFNSRFPGKSLYGFGILIQDEDCYRAQKKKTKVSYGEYVSALAQLTQGKNISICEKDYSNSLSDISQTIRSNILGNHVSLDSFPQKGSIKVEIDPIQNVNWKVSGKKVLFTPALKVGTSVSISYQVE